MTLHRTKTRKTSPGNWNALDVLLEGCQIIDFELCYVYVNKIAAAQGQKTVEEMLGHNILDVYPDIEQNKVFLRIQKCLKNRTPCKIENKFILPDGSRGWFELSIEPVPEGVLILSRDITEYKHLLETIEKSKALLQAVIDSSPDWIFVEDVDHRFLLVNKTFSNAFGTNPKSVVGKLDTEVLSQELCQGNPENGIKGIREKDDLVFSGVDFHNTEYVTNLPDGSNHILDVYKIPLKDTRSKTYAALSYFRDITEQRLAENELKKSYEKVRHTLLSVVEFMGTIVEKRDPYTAGHQRRVTDLACAIAKEMGLPENTVEQIHIGGMLHDIGKIYIPAEILSKPGKLNESEFNIIKHHSQMGYEIVNKIEFPSQVAAMVLSHHERLDGSGYPRGLHGKDIGIESKIIAVADVVEAMSSHKPYRPALGIDVALAEIAENRGKLYDVRAVDTCIKLFREKGFSFKSDTQIL